MSDNSVKPIQWNFTAETNAQGRTYIKAYKMAWDKVAKKPKRIMRRHVGRLADDGRILISPKFLQDHPQYENQDWYWGTQHKPVSLAEYQEEFPKSSGTPADEEDQELLPTLNVGLTWAAWQTACRHQIQDHLEKVFGKELGRELLYLAIYKLAGGGAMCSYDIWRQQVWLPSNVRLSGEKISDILTSITQDQLLAYFKLRHDRQIEIRKSQPRRKDCKIEYAMDSTSIATYSATNELAQYGHAKCDPALKQINQTFVCDQRSGDILFTHVYDGSVNDVASLQDVLCNMTAAGFDLSDNVLITDRGYASLLNVQQMINLELSFVQGVKRIETAIDCMFEKHKASLMNGAFYNGDLKASAFVYTEPWQQNTDSGTIQTKSYVHLYRLDDRYERQRALIWKKASEIIDLKTNDRRVPQDLWDDFGRFVDEREDENGKKTWSLNTARMDEASEKATRFVLRSNCISISWQNIFRHLKHLPWSGKTCDIRKSSKTRP